MALPNAVNYRQKKQDHEDDHIKYFYYFGLKEWQTSGTKERLLDVFLSKQDDMKAILDYFEIEYDKTEVTAKELLKK